MTIMTSAPIRVVIIDDSALMRRVLTTILTRDPAIQVVGEGRDGHEGIRTVESLRPDVVILDVTMPGLDGLATTEHLMAFCPTPILVLTASLMRGEVDITFKMLGAGALEVVEKPKGNSPELLERASRDLIRRIKVLARVKVVTHLRGRRRLSDGLVQSGAESENLKLEAVEPRRPGDTEPRRAAATPAAAVATLQRQPAVAIPRQAPAVSLSKPTGETFPLIVIGASTGGPRIVYRILSELPRDLQACVLIVQHIAEGFSAGMVEWLQSASNLPVVLGTEGLQLRQGIAVVAPDQRDTMINPDERIHLTQSPLLIQRPSVDIAMQAAAEVFATRAIGVLLTGMGRDGAYGLLTIQRRGGRTIAQEEQSCTVFGMPRAAIQLGAANEVLTPAQIAPRLTELVRRSPSIAPAPGGKR
jgi:two-component system chemotaxis response regulator CheB